MARRWVCLDIGETLVDETRVWSTWAGVLGIPAFTFCAVLGAAIARGRDHREAFAVLGVADWERLQPLVDERYGGFSRDDLYPDAVRAVERLGAAGFGVAVVGNQPARRSAELRAIGVAPDVLRMSEELGVEKPQRAFFEALLRLVGAAPSDVAYVGDRVDNDVEPAVAAGLRAVWLRRGPWGLLQRDPTGAASLVIASLDALADEVSAAFP